MASRVQIQSMADRLISTLSTLMPSDKADAIVRDVATELYVEVLGIEGKVMPTNYGIAHGSFGKNGKRGAMAIADYAFKPEKEVK